MIWMTRWGNWKNYKEEIKKCRMRKGYSQAKLASELGVAPFAVAFYEIGKRLPKIEIREKIAKILEADPVELSGLDLSEADEIRLINKLLVKYAKSIQVIRDGGSNNGCVSVVLPKSFVTFAEKYLYYQNIIRAAQSENNKENSEETKAAIERAKEEFDFLLETWPEHDFRHLIAGRRLESEMGEES